MAIVGISDHSGWAIAMTVSADGTVHDRRRIALLDPGVPAMPHHHDGQKLPVAEAVALVERVTANAERNAALRIDELAHFPITGIALRECPAWLPSTIAERITNYRAMCVADWVMYRQALARAAIERGWAVHWFDPKQPENPKLLAAAKQALGSPWTKDHRMAMTAALLAAR